MTPLVVFSHLRWDFVYQRPQQIMARLAENYRIVFIEEPVFDAGGPDWEIAAPEHNVVVCRPHSPISAPGFHDDQIPVLKLLLAALITDYGLEEPLLWLYTPMALPLIAEFNPGVLVYDCMDELSGFKNAPRQVLQREHALLKVTDLVFTGGLSLYAAKQSRHPDVHCFPSSVDAAHFAAARDAATDHPSQRSLPHPRLGFFGVIDERMDTPLLDTMALAHPEWQIIMVGPVVKIDPSTLPVRSNIHYVGQQSYADLPRFLAGWDLCLLPFAQNEATEYISPTKTLEYMAAEKPIVSTPIADVIAQYGHIVRVGSGRHFMVACEHALAESSEQREDNVLVMRGIVGATSWQRTVADMATLIDAKLAGRSTVNRPSLSEDMRAPDGIATPSLKHPPKVVIIGAGPTGLSAAYSLGEASLLLERSDTVGGWCRSIVEEGFTFDHAGHIMFSTDPYVHDLYEKLLGDNVHWQDREAWIYSKGVHTRYPFQAALYGLPPEVVSECLMGAIEARRGPLEPSGGASRKQSSRMSPKNFEEFIFQVWGEGIAKHFAIPYNRKLWTVPLASMETSWLGGRVPLPDLKEMIDGALSAVAKPMGPNARFGYPLRGGFQALMDGFVPLLKGRLELNAGVVRVRPAARTLTLASGAVVSYEQLISTMPLPSLIELMKGDAPPHVRLAASKLRHVSVRCVNLGIDRERLTDKHWIYYPESSIFHRIFVQGNASPYCNAPNGFALTCEITYSPEKPLPCDGDALIDRCIEDCISVGMFTERDKILVRNQIDMPYAYVIYDHARAQSVALIREWAAQFGIILSGRYSEWEYYNSDHAFLAGRNAANVAIAALHATNVRTDDVKALSTM